MGNLQGFFKCTILYTFTWREQKSFRDLLARWSHETRRDWDGLMSRLFSRRDRLVTGPKASESSKQDLCSPSKLSSHTCVFPQKAKTHSWPRRGLEEWNWNWCIVVAGVVLSRWRSVLASPTWHMVHGHVVSCVAYVWAKWSFFLVIRRGNLLLARWYNYKGCLVQKKMFLFEQKKRL